MGCASSAHTISATGDSLSKQSRINAPSSISKGEIVLKDLPEVVEKVIDVFNENNSEIDLSCNKKVGSINLKNNFDDLASETEVKTFIQDADSEGIVQGFLTDDVSTTSSSQQSVQEDIGKHYKLNENRPIVSADVDSLRTSSPESEIEEALAKNNYQNPPTPKPTFSELEDLAKLPINTTTFALENVVCENPKANNYLNKSANIPTVFKNPTEWEKQADILANTQKFNPIEAMRKLRKENRSSSGLPHRGEIKPKMQRYIEEDLSNFIPMESPLRSNLSSARSERGKKTNSSEPDTKGYSNIVGNDILHKKLDEGKLKKPPDNKRKENNILVSRNAEARSPSLYKIRERCVVCCNKYKH